MHNVVIAAYNAERHIGGALQSVLDQTYRNLQIVVVDDGSTDKTREVIEGFSDPRIIYVGQTNSGQAKAWAEASRHIIYSGLVFLLDADDLMTTNRVEVVDAVYREHVINNGERISLIQHSLEVVDVAGRVLERQPYAIDQDSINDPLDWYGQRRIGQFYPTTGLCVPSQLFSGMFPLQTKWKICADAFLTRKLGFYGKIISLKACLGKYRVHGSNHWFGTNAHDQKLNNRCHFARYIDSLMVQRNYNHRPFRYYRVKFYFGCLKRAIRKFLEKNAL